MTFLTLASFTAASAAVVWSMVEQARLSRTRRKSIEELREKLDAITVRKDGAA